MTATDISSFNRATFANLDTDFRESRLRKALQLAEEEPPGHILDIGCGRGGFAARLMTKGWRASGIDMTEEQVAVACSAGLDARVADVAHRGLPFDDQAFDCVFAGEIIEHLVDTDLFLAEIRRVLKPGACVILTTPNLASFENRLRLLLGLYPMWVDYRLAGVGHVRAYTPRILKRQLGTHGFRVEKHRVIGCRSSRSGLQTMSAIPGSPSPAIGPHRLQWTSS